MGQYIAYRHALTSCTKCEERLQYSISAEFIIYGLPPPYPVTNYVFFTVTHNHGLACSWSTSRCCRALDFYVGALQTINQYTTCKKCIQQEAFPTRGVYHEKGSKSEGVVLASVITSELVFLHWYHVILIHKM